MLLFLVYPRSCESLLSHYEVEIFEGDLVSVGCGSLEHFPRFMGAHGPTEELLGDSSQILNVVSAWLVIVE